MFEVLSMAPPDSILGITEAFKKDPNPAKINLSVGVYQDALGQTPVLESVKEVERRLLASETNKGYLGIDGLPEYADAVRELLFGASHPIVTGRRAVTAQTPGGTAALRVAADFLASRFRGRRIWCSVPTWANHPSVFAAAGLEVGQYPYFDAGRNRLDIEGLLSAFQELPPGDTVLLHGGCHNPTGIDPTADQWREIAAVIRERSLLPLIDFAYQGFAAGIESDAAGLRTVVGAVPEALVCSSFSKNFGLYGERVGALTVVAATAQAADVALSHVKTCIRVNYSNPPKHGGLIVATILRDQALRARWEQEVAQMRSRINGMRTLFVDSMKARVPGRDFSFIARQRGMFSFSGLTPLEVDELRGRFGIYVVGNGRINVAGMTESNMNLLCDAIAAVLAA